jgi:hypothetical protein
MHPALRLSAAALAACLMVQASGPIAVYALIDQVTLEPNAEKPQRARISGVFVTAAERTDNYSSPQKGYLYFKLPADSQEYAVREWNDLKSVAGTRQVVGFGSSWVGSARVHKEGEQAEPAEYILGNGVVKINADQPRAKALLEYKEH